MNENTNLSQEKPFQQYLSEILTNNPDVKLDIAYTSPYSTHYHNNATQNDVEIQAILEPFLNTPAKSFVGTEKITPNGKYDKHQITVYAERELKHPAPWQINAKHYPQTVYQTLKLEFKLEK
ncbi:MAG: hypothetical protein WC758_06935 [Candidatus Woesearchaeota archaeon]|jgi:hypothetical protein